MSIFINPKVSLFFVTLIACSSPAFGRPSWWSSALTPGALANDNAVATMGQAMHMAKTARDQLNAQVGATAAEDAIVIAGDSGVGGRSKTCFCPLVIMWNGMHGLSASANLKP